MSARTVLCLAALVALPLGCDRVVQPDLDPADYVLPGVQYACRQWLPEAPAVELGLFDIYWGRPSPAIADDRPTEEHRLLVQMLGGVVIYEFHVRMIRAVIAPDRVPELGASVVRGVPLVGAYPVDVFVRFADAVDEDVVTFIEAGGGRILNRFDNFATVAAVVPDAMIPALRGRRGVTAVEGVPLGCQHRFASPSFSNPLARISLASPCSVLPTAPVPHPARAGPAG